MSQDQVEQRLLLHVEVAKNVETGNNFEVLQCSSETVWEFKTTTMCTVLINKCVLILFKKAYFCQL